MNYELAKQLKDAGYRQFTNEQSPINASWRYERPTDGSDIVFIPTLSELIEACGDDFQDLHRWSNGKWTCNEKMEVTDYESEGQTAEEAVSNLWLTLNKK